LNRKEKAVMGGEETVLIGRVIKPHGLRGEVRIFPETDFPERFEQSDRFLLRLGRKETWVHVESVRWQGDYLLVRFSGIDTRQDAEQIRNAEVEIPRSWCHHLPEGEYYIADLIGLKVRTQTGESIGKLVDVIHQTAQDIYVIRVDADEILIPAVPQFIKRIDLKKGEIIIDPIEGLLN
jgi:16S rRNA processing protein RimM